MAIARKVLNFMKKYFIGKEARFQVQAWSQFDNIIQFNFMTMLRVEPAQIHLSDTMINNSFTQAVSIIELSLADLLHERRRFVLGFGLADMRLDGQTRNSIKAIRELRSFLIRDASVEQRFNIIYRMPELSIIIDKLLYYNYRSKHSEVALVKEEIQQDVPERHNETDGTLILASSAEQEKEEISSEDED